MTPHQLIRQAEKNSQQNFLWVLSSKHTLSSIEELRNSLFLEPTVNVVVDSCGGFDVHLENQSRVNFHKRAPHATKGMDLDGCVIEDLSDQDMHELHDILYPSVVARDGWIIGTYFHGQPMELDVVVIHSALKPFIADIEGLND